MENTTVIYSSSGKFDIITAEHTLRDAGIEYFTVNKKDSAYVVISGQSELYVRNEDVISAKKLLADKGIFKKLKNIRMSNLKDTSMVMFSVSDLRIITAKHVLKEAGIEAFTINKKDSAHAGIFGEIELYVDQAHEKEAREILLAEEIIKA